MPGTIEDEFLGKACLAARLPEETEQPIDSAETRSASPPESTKPKGNLWQKIKKWFS
jgi:hypothetical protein